MPWTPLLSLLIVFPQIKALMYEFPSDIILTGVPAILAQQGGGGAGIQMLILIMLFAGMWFLIIAPQRKKQKEHDALVRNLKSGDAVITNGGIYGTVISVKPDRFVIRIADDTKVEVARNYIAGLAPAKNSGEKAAKTAG